MGNNESESNNKLPFQEREEGGFHEMKDEFSKVCKCSYKTRLIGFAICFALGWALSIFATILFIINKNITVFAVMYSIGQVISITGSCFLAGPKQQFKDMTKKTRLLLSILYVTSTIATLVLAFVLPENLKALVLVSLVVQIVSYFFYTLSYVPFGRKILAKCCECLIF